MNTSTMTAPFTQGSDRDAVDDLATCMAALRTGSRTFYAASRVLPLAVRSSACGLYTFCREADDAVDQGSDPRHAVMALDHRLERLYAHAPLPASAPLADRAMATVVRRHQIPQAMPQALIQGFAWDAEGRRYDTLDALYDYAARVAGSVGAMMALLMGVRSPHAVARACELGVAMQLSNIARDVGEDARMGRLYLPLAWMREEGLDPDDWLGKPGHTPALGRVVQRLVAAADDMYERVGGGVAMLPLSCRPGINAARLLYADIGHEVMRRGGDAISQRAVVGRSRQLWLLGQAVIRLYPSRQQAEAPPLEAIRFLVDALNDPTCQRVPMRAEDAWWRADRHFSDRLERVLTLFERLEREERRPTSPAWPQRR